MTKIFTFLFFVCTLCVNINAQIIEKTPQKGVNCIYNIAKSENINEGKSGKNQTWDMTHITDSSSGNMVTYNNVENTPFEKQFPNANLVSITTPLLGGLLQNKNMYAYFKYDSLQKVIYSYGGTMNGQVLKYDKPCIAYKFPFAINDELNDTFTASLMGMQCSGDIHTKADASGKLKLPFGTFEVLRVKSSQMIKISMGGMEMITITTTYSFYNPEYFSPLVTINYVKNMDQLGESISLKFVKYYQP